ncbi:MULTISPECIES: GNAT family N-acetyltransferase [unclassified Pseudoalteromonas]|uniref:GNAT family N-acetyltransferase n=1 Tax=unclassified Pseudoalteromonas TaxID=194690 RepID=UPI0025B5579F|nr:MULTISPECIES: GNAT family N-acetyltransferase [unclassified Pseudoalteromonas]MDN3380429.1 GNAT family N-acetyltransferase [Pseudoalteromonas sp. APC 3893]MDN3388814.1 GNAT family N-acetyltransferase [Pseudoalteromonas sp. APC 4017]
MHDFKQFNTELNKVLSQLAYAKHRQLLLITGEQNWCYLAAQHLLHELNESKINVLSKSTELTPNFWPEHTHQILGQEFDHAIYDGFSGILPDKLAALSGTVKAGGLLVLLLPELSNLKNWCDPALTYFQSYAQNQPRSFFNQRLARLLTQSKALHFNQSNGYTDTQNNAVEAGVIDLTEQQTCIEQIVKTANGRANRPLLISADRGRGKSSALGFAAAQLSDKKIVICAQQFTALHSCFKHLAQARNLSYKNSDKQLANLHFSPPDQLLNELPECDVLFVDEAASIPVPMLMKMLTHYPRVIFASTMMGYEGNGRGYTLKFKRYLQTHYKNMRSIELTQPIRFAANDPLENQLSTLLALDADYQQINISSDKVEFSQLSRERLAHDEDLLKQIVSLLSLAHYQNSVNDLRHLLDAPSQRVFVASLQNKVVAVCLVAIEGGLTTDISEQIVIGKRRPQGHLMAQTLAQLSFDSTILNKYCARVVRIAVSPSLHQKNIGSQLLRYCENKLTLECDYFGASFGANATLLKFWQSNGFKLVKLGFQQDKATAEHAALVVKSLANGNLINQLEQQFQSDFALQLLDQFKLLDHQLVEIVITQCSNKQAISPQIKRLDAILATAYQLFTVKPILWRVFWQSPSTLKNCETRTKYLFIRLILQNWSLQEVKIALKISGKKTLEQQFKQAVINWYEKLTHTIST